MNGLAENSDNDSCVGRGRHARGHPNPHQREQDHDENGDKGEQTQKPITTKLHDMTQEMFELSASLRPQGAPHRASATATAACSRRRRPQRREGPCHGEKSNANLTQQGSAKATSHGSVGRPRKSATRSRRADFSPQGGFPQGGRDYFLSEYDVVRMEGQLSQTHATWLMRKKAAEH